MKILAALVAVFAAAPAFAQYNAIAGRSAPATERVAEPKTDDRGRTYIEYKEVAPKRDSYGNAAGATYDLAVDGAFEGQTVMVVALYYADQIEGPRAALREKGFNMAIYNRVPPLKQFKAALKKSNQFWIISSCDNSVHLSPEHQAAVKEFFNEGHGVYIWGDNDPCNADADKLASMLVDARVSGDIPGDKTVGLSTGAGKPGVVKDHLLSTGVETVYEGVTIATVRPAGAMTPVIYGSAGNLVAAAFDKNGKRLIVDGGYTRLANKWDSAGTGRYIRNAAAWLANYEKFGDAVVASEFKKRQ